MIISKNNNNNNNKDLQKISPTQMDRIMELLKQESPENLKYNLRLAPSKVSDFVVKNLLNPAQ